jgi:hypothetical protein
VAEPSTPTQELSLYHFISVVSLVVRPDKYNVSGSTLLTHSVRFAGHVVPRYLAVLLRSHKDTSSIALPRDHIDHIRTSSSLRCCGLPACMFASSRSEVPLSTCSLRCALFYL